MTSPTHPEHGTGWLILLALCLMIQPLVADMVRETLKPAPAVDARLKKYTYLGRDDEGRPEWSYGYDR